MTKRILVGYSTWSGATHEVADAIAGHLKKAGSHADSSNLKKIKDISEYDVFILGTSIHASRPMTTFINFIRKNHAELASKPTALFAVCANLFEDTPENRAETLSWLQESLKGIPEIPFIDIGLFGGAVLTDGDDYQKLNPFVKAIIKSMKKSVEEKMGKADFRDWDKIKNWAEAIGKKLT